MANTQTKASAKYQAKTGIIAKTYKLKKTIVDEFAETCKANDVGVAATLTSLMEEYIEKNKK